MLILIENEYNTHMLSSPSVDSGATVPGISYANKLFRLKERYAKKDEAENKCRQLLDEGMLCLLTETANDSDGTYLWVEAATGSKIKGFGTLLGSLGQAPEKRVDNKPQHEVFFRGRRITNWAPQKNDSPSGSDTRKH